MNITRNPALVDQLAASYALGTLRGGARRRFEALARTHAPVRAAALIWQGRMASVTELQPQAAPSPAVWKRIENLVQADKQASAMQAARQAPAAAAGGGWWASLGLWRGATRRRRAWPRCWPWSPALNLQHRSSTARCRNSAPGWRPRPRSSTWRCWPTTRPRPRCW